MSEHERSGEHLEPQPHGGALRRAKAAPAADRLGLDAPSDGLWLTITQLARRKRKGKPWISERVSRLAAEGLIHTRPGPGRSKLVNLAEYDRAVGEVGDPAKDAAAATKAEDAAAAGEPGRDPKYRDAKANEAHYAAELKRLEFEERTGKLVPLADVIAVADQCSSVIASAIDRLPMRSAEMVAAVDKERDVGARRVFREASLELRRTAADALAQLAGSPRAPDQALPSAGDESA